MKIISWNVNGIRAILKKGFFDFVKKENPDILCLQETKASPEQVNVNLSDYKFIFWNSAEKKGYSGTVVFSKIKPLSVSYGMALAQHDSEGRVITLELKNFFLVNVYTPNSKRGLLRLSYRQKWDEDFQNYLKYLKRMKPVIVCGDFNVAHKEIDLKNPNSNHQNAGFTDEEREGFTKLLEDGFIDTFREFEKGPGHYTWWSYMFHARERDIGWRIDYFIASKYLRKQLKNAFILKKIMGSDHCPVGLVLK
ncbi:MAG: exodeoxyribonuclease III [Nanoarchaeota archaeon]|nr:exodeoxyribonuclease III [Nanoarchaeota archaeon]MBU1030434.1 exodeoxyribonuclease III [Nanoarchaeota archaeon]MBU1849783.1 exodeoxyribonuclease III [Nanoarchaeota archaeon]